MLVFRVLSKFSCTIPVWVSYSRPVGEPGDLGVPGVLGGSGDVSFVLWVRR